MYKYKVKCSKKVLIIITHPELLCGVFKRLLDTLLQCFKFEFVWSIMSFIEHLSPTTTPDDELAIPYIDDLSKK